MRIENIEFTFISDWILEDNNLNYAHKWYTFFKYVLDTCIKLKTMNISITFESILENSTNKFLSTFEKILKIFSEEVIPQILELKNSCKPILNIKLRAFVPKYFLEVILFRLMNTNKFLDLFFNFF